MILLGEPYDKSEYTFVIFEKGKILHSSGIIPIYKDIKNGGFWFNKSDINGGDE